MEQGIQKEHEMIGKYGCYLICLYKAAIVQGWFVLAKILWFTEWKWSLILIPTYIIGFLLLVAFIKCMIEMFKELHKWEKEEKK